MFADLLAKDLESSTPARGATDVSRERPAAEREDSPLRERPMAERDADPAREPQRSDQPSEGDAHQPERPAAEQARPRDDAEPAPERPIEESATHSDDAQPTDAVEQDASSGARSDEVTARPESDGDAGAPVADEPSPSPLDSAPEVAPEVVHGVGSDAAPEDALPEVEVPQVAQDDRPLGSELSDAQREEQTAGATAPAIDEALPASDAPSMEFDDERSQPVVEELGGGLPQHPTSQEQPSDQRPGEQRPAAFQAPSEQPQTAPNELAASPLTAAVRPSETEDAAPYPSAPQTGDLVEAQTLQAGVTEATAASSGALSDAEPEPLDTTAPNTAATGGELPAESQAAGEVSSGARQAAPEAPAARETAPAERAATPTRGHSAAPAAEVATPHTPIAEQAPVVDAAPTAHVAAPEARVAAPSGAGEVSSNSATVNATSAHDNAPTQRNQPVAQATAPARPMPIDPGALERADAILDQVRLRLKPGLKRASLSLRPESLGRISISLSVEDGRMSAAVRAESAETLAALERHVPELRALMAQADLDVQEFELTLVPDGASFDFADEGPESEQHDGAAAGGDSQPEQPGAAQRASLREMLASDAGLDFYA